MTLRKREKKTATFQYPQMCSGCPWRGGAVPHSPGPARPGRSPPRSKHGRDNAGMGRAGRALRSHLSTA